ncbi:MAG: hypothetical protein PWQ79_1335 [Thermococcaceae archaeon]|nr:hypothetical protein [Thermococcaceae archaeon]MDK2914420.1 hypothetical protein [Thermococcaceae archaeon]
MEEPKSLSELVDDAHMALFIPLELRAPDKSLDRLENVLKEASTHGHPCPRDVLEFTFTEVYSKRTSRIKIPLEKDITISYIHEGEQRSVKMKITPLLTVFYDTESGNKDKIIPITYKNTILFPAVLSLLISEIKAEPADILIDDLLIIPHHVLWPKKECRFSTEGKELTLEEYLESLKTSLQSHLKVPNLSIKFIEEGRMFVVNLRLKEKALGSSESLRDVILESFPNEVYGLSVTDEGYHTVPKEYARRRMEEWSWTTRNYMLNVLSPVSIIQIKLNVDREGLEINRMNRCRTWEGYMKSQSRGSICEHGLYFKGEYIALTFSTFHALEDILKETVGRAIPSAELREGKSASQEDTVIDTVKELREFLEELYSLKATFNKFLDLLQPSKVSRIPEVTVALDKMYELRGLGSFSDSAREKIGDISEIIQAGSEIIEQNIENQRLHNLEFGLGLADTFPIGYLLERVGVLDFINSHFGTGLKMEDSIVLMVLAIIAWSAWRGRTLKEMERFEIKNFVEMCRTRVFS